MCVGAVRPRIRTASGVRFRDEAAVLGVPFRARPAHIVQVRPIGAFAAEARAPQSAEGFGKVIPHGTLRGLATE